ncbi:MAG TPA: porin, partial [Gammaproteobacteria bacterium]
AGATTVVTTGGGAVAAGNKVSQDAWIINWEHTFGNFQLLAMYGQLGKMSGCAVAAVCANTKADSFLVGGRYLLSKRTWVYVSYQQVDNEANQFVDYLAGGITSTTGAPTPFGADPSVLALGVFHNF